VPEPQDFERTGAPAPAYSTAAPPGGSGAVRPLKTAAPEPLPERIGPASGIGAVGPARSRGLVRPLPAGAQAKPQVVSPVSFDDAQELADRFKANNPVIMNLQNADRDLARRLIDFASGLCYGLGGKIEKAANQVYLLTPTNVEVSAEERRRVERGLYG
jgi:cell division inhibitor SepF